MWGVIQSPSYANSLNQRNAFAGWHMMKRRLLAELLPHLRIMAQFSLMTGLWESSVTKLEWGQINMQRYAAWIHPDQAKAEKAIGVPLNDVAINIIREQIGNNQRYVFVYKGKTILRVNNHAWKKALMRGGNRWFSLARFTPHVGKLAYSSRGAVKCSSGTWRMGWL